MGLNSMFKKHRIKCILLIFALLLGVGVAVVFLTKQNSQDLAEDMITNNDDEPEVLYDPIEYNAEKTWYLLPLDLELYESVQLRFVKRLQYYVVEERQILVNDTFYTHEHIWFIDRIEFEIVNTTDYLYSFGQIYKAAKLVDDNWYAFRGYPVDVFLWLAYLPPNETREWSVHTMTALPDDYVIGYGVYKFLKPVWRGYDPRGTQKWAYLIIQFE